MAVCNFLLRIVLGTDRQSEWHIVEWSV